MSGAGHLITASHQFAASTPLNDLVALKAEEWKAEDEKSGGKCQT